MIKNLWDKYKAPVVERVINGKRVQTKEAMVELDDLSPDPKNGRLAMDFIRARMEGKRVTQAVLRDIMESRGDIKSLAESMRNVKVYQTPAWGMDNGLLVDGNRRFYAMQLNREIAVEAGDHRGVFENSKMRCIIFHPDVTYDDLMVAVYAIHQEDVVMDWDPACQASQTAEIIASGKMTKEQIAKLKRTTVSAVEEQVRAFKAMKRWLAYCLRNGNPVRVYRDKDTGVETRKERDPADYWTFVKRVVRHKKAVMDALGESDGGAERYMFDLVHDDRIEDCQMFDQLHKVLSDRVARKIMESGHPEHGSGCRAAFGYLNLDVRQVRSARLDPVTQRIVAAANAIRQNRNLLADPKNGDNRRKAIVTLRRLIEGVLA